MWFLGALRTLVLSDIHYPTGISEACFDAIVRERPDVVVLLGDTVVGRGERLLRNMREFLERYPHPKHRSVFLVGDNEIRGNRKILGLIAGLPKLNRDPFSYVSGNMFFTHGNLEGIGPFSAVLEELGALVARLTKPAVPRLVSRLFRLKSGLDRRFFLFLGHIHFLGYLQEEHTVFCGTFSTKRIVFGPEESLGYVVVEHSDKGLLEPDAIRLVRLR